MSWTIGNAPLSVVDMENSLGSWWDWSRKLFQEGRYGKVVLTLFLPARNEPQGPSKEAKLDSFSILQIGTPDTG